ncbi:bacteriocin [Scytonema tolypothrichoides VB-61278]|nr:bacteriocin [Scytonema tolypothrichoides VB-61278]
MEKMNFTNFKGLVDNIKITELQSDNQIDELSNEELQQVVGGSSEIDNLRQRLKDLGIDVEAIEQFVRDLFGNS